jgi:predicted amidohydrolase YtcJ
MTAESRVRELILFSTNVITATEDGFAGPAAIHVVDGLINGIGTLDEIEAAAGPGVEVVNFGDRTIMPGFVDPHAHSEVACRTAALTVDCRAPKCSTIPEVLASLRRGLGEQRGGWLVGQANLFFDQKLAEKRFPTRAELDSVSTDVAIALRCGGHLTVLNSRAMDVAGITASFVDGLGSITGKPEVEVDELGEPTGVVKEMDSLLPLPRLSDAELEAAIRARMTRLFTEFGVTTVGEIAESKAGLAAYDSLLAAGDPLPRMHFYLWVPGFTSLDDACNYAAWPERVSGPELLRIHGVKIFSDGGYSAKSAAMKRPYSNSHSHYGSVAMSKAELIEALIKTNAAGLQLAVHANGDKAQEVVCNAFAEVANELDPGVTPPRIEHAGNFVPDYEELTSAWKAAGILPVPQPVFLYNFGEFVPDYLGSYAESGQFPFRRLLDDGWPVSGSSDVWIGSEIGQTNPFLSIASAVARRSFHGFHIEADQAVTPYEALRMHTANAASVMGLAGSRGTLEAGKLADIIVLDRDPLSASPDEYLEIQVTDVFRGGVRLLAREEVSSA